jgi:hypothetical protein
MKKLILLSLFTAAIVSCGAKKEETVTAQVQTDPAPVTPKEELPAAPAVKDYNYYLNLAKNFTLEGTKLTHYNTYADTSSKNYSVTFSNREKDAAFNKIVMACGRVNAYTGDDKATFENYTLEGYNKMMNINREKKSPEIKGKEYVSGDKKFFYSIRKNIKGSMGEKDYNIVGYSAVMDGFVLNGNVIVNDLKSDMVLAEEVMKKIADYFAK